MTRPVCLRIARFHFENALCIYHFSFRPFSPTIYTMNSIFEYDSYRKFLGDFFQEMKSKRRTFSYRSFARKAGFASCGFFHQVVTGERNLTKSAIEKMISGVGISGKKAQYFKALVQFEQAEQSEDKSQAFAEMNLLRKDSAFFRMNRSHFRYFENWWYPVLRNLVVYARWNQDYALLANLVEPPISEAQAKYGVEVLEELGMIHKNKAGKWSLSNVLVSSADIPGLVKSTTRQEVLQLGLDALERFPAHERHATYYTLAIKANSYDRIIEHIEELNARASLIASEDEEVDRIYELAVMLYPLSKTLGKKS